MAKLTKHERKVSVTVTVPPDTLDKIDAAADKAGQYRSVWMREAINEKLEKRGKR